MAKWMRENIFVTKNMVYTSVPDLILLKTNTLNEMTWRFSIYSSGWTSGVFIYISLKWDCKCIQSPPPTPPTPPIPPGMGIVLDRPEARHSCMIIFRLCISTMLENLKLCPKIKFFLGNLQNCNFFIPNSKSFKLDFFWKLNIWTQFHSYNSGNFWETLVAVRITINSANWFVNLRTWFLVPISIGAIQIQTKSFVCLDTFLLWNQTISVFINCLKVPCNILTQQSKSLCQMVHAVAFLDFSNRQSFASVFPITYIKDKVNDIFT